MDKSDNTVAPLGDYITLGKRKNKNLESTNLVGISMNEGILDNPRKSSEAYLRTGWIADTGEFIVDLVNVQHNNRLAVDINRTNRLMVVSHIYNVFSITNSSQLNGEYLLLVLKNSVTELRLKWACHGSVRGTLSWENFANIPISVPPLNKQERIVNKYQTITKYIELKKRINELFEQQMTAYYHVLFDHLTDYTIRNFGEILSIIRGGRPPRGNQEQESKYFCKEGGIPWLQVRDVTKQQYKFPLHISEQLTSEGFKRGKCKIVPAGSVVVVGSGVNTKALGFCMVSFCDLVLNTTLWGVTGNDSAGGAFLFLLLTFTFWLKKISQHSKEWLIVQRIEFLLISKDLMLLKSSFRHNP